MHVYGAEEFCVYTKYCVTVLLLIKMVSMGFTVVLEIAHSELEITHFKLISKELN